MLAVVTTAAGLLGGLMLSALLWHVTVHVIRPTVEFSDHISKIVEATGRELYRIKIRNPSRRRGVIDLAIRVSVRYPAVALNPVARSGNITSFSLHVQNPAIFRLAPGRAQVVDIDFDDTLAGKAAQDIIATVFPVQTQREGLTLGGLLRRSSGSYVILMLLC